MYFSRPLKFRFRFLYSTRISLDEESLQTALFSFVNEVSVSNYRPISVLYNIAQDFGFDLHVYMSHWFNII